MFENWMPRRIFGPKRDEVTRVEKMHNEELRDLCTSSRIIAIMKSMWMVWAGPVA
jgi:hypothetical protein